MREGERVGMRKNLEDLGATFLHIESLALRRLLVLFSKKQRGDHIMKRCSIIESTWTLQWGETELKFQWSQKKVGRRQQREKEESIQIALFPFTPPPSCLFWPTSLYIKAYLPQTLRWPSTWICGIVES